MNLRTYIKLYIHIGRGYCRRSYSAWAKSKLGRRSAGAAAMTRDKEKLVSYNVNDVTDADVGERSAFWIPDPITGFYKPADHMDEIDVVKLRNALLNKKRSS